MIFYFSGSSVIGIVFGIIFIDIGLQGAYIKSNACLFDTTWCKKPYEYRFHVF
jgi:hypothetical protein